MSDPSDDDIARWAESLKPEGAPGIMQQSARAYFGDERYDVLVKQNDDAIALAHLRQRAINNILAIVVLFGLVGLVGFVAVVFKFIF